MSFGTELWDQVKAVEQYVENGNQYMDKVNDFLKNIVAAEQEYARALTKAAKPIKDEQIKRMNDKSKVVKTLLDSSNYQAWVYVLSEVENIADSHLEIAHTLEEDVRKNLKIKRKINAANAAKNYEVLAASKLDLRKVMDKLERGESKQESCIKDMELAKESLELGKQTAFKDPKKVNLEKLNSEYEKKAGLAQDAMYESSKLLRETNEVKNRHFKTIIPSVLDLIQKDDETVRIDSIKSTIMEFSAGYKKLSQKLEASLGKISLFADKISAFSDTRFFVQVMASGEQVPEDLDLKDTAKADRDKKLAIRGNGSASTNNSIQDEDDEIIKMGPKKGRKKAAEKVKSIEKEIVDVEKREFAFELLTENCRQKDSTALADLDVQKSSLLVRKNSLFLKRHKLMVFIAQADGTPIPEEPVGNFKFADKASRSPSRINGSESYVERAPSNKDSLPVVAESDMPVEKVFGVDVDASGGRKCKALYDFDAAEDTQEMSVVSGQILGLILDQEDGWWLCKNNETGVEGYVPGTYLEKC